MLIDPNATIALCADPSARGQLVTRIAALPANRLAHFQAEVAREQTYCSLLAALLHDATERARAFAELMDEQAETLAKVMGIGEEADREARDLAEPWLVHA